MILDQFQRPLRDLRISVTDKCNFRCPYCMPIEVYGEDYQFSPKSEVLTFEEIVRLTRLFVQAGAEKIRLTGGEPLLRKSLPNLISSLAAISGVKDLTLTTNGWFLPQQAEALKTAGLARVTVSLDSLDDQVAGRMNGRGYGVERVLEGINAAIAAGLTPVKVNVVVKRGENEDSVVKLARYFRRRGVIVRYIEFMDVGNRNGWRLDHVVPAAEIVEAISSEMPLEPSASASKKVRTAALAGSARAKNKNAAAITRATASILLRGSSSGQVKIISMWAGTLKCCWNEHSSLTEPKTSSSVEYRWEGPTDRTRNLEEKFEWANANMRMQPSDLCRH